MTIWTSIKSGLMTFSATTRDTFGCTGNHGDAIDDDDDNNYVADSNGKGDSSQPAFVEIDFLRSDLNHHRKYPDNSIRTAKYTLASGLPLSLLYQFYKISNFYFLLVMIISLVPGASPINPFSSVVPLCIVLGAGIIKDLWEDWKRRKADQQANEMIVHVLRVPLQSDKSKPKSSAKRSSSSNNSSSDAVGQGGTPDTASPGTEVTGIGTTGSGHTDSGDVLLRTNAKATQPRHSTSTISHNNNNNTNGAVPGKTLNTTTSDSDEHNNNNNNNSATVVVVSDGNTSAPPAREGGDPPKKRKRVVHFLFPSEKSKSKNNVQVVDGSGNASPHRNVEMSAFEKVDAGLSGNTGSNANSTAAPALSSAAVVTAAPPPQPILKSDHADATAAAPTPMRSALSGTHTPLKDTAQESGAATADVDAGVYSANPSANSNNNNNSNSAAASASYEPKVTFQPIRSCDVYPGDIMLFRLGEEVKADCLILNTSLPDGLTYIETANLDGETNAKTRRAKIQTVEALGTVEDIIELSLGVPATNAAAVFAKMNGVDLTNGGSSATGEAPTKVRVNSCSAVGAHVVMSPEQEAKNAMTAAASAQNVVVVAPAPEPETPAGGTTTTRHTTPLGPAKSAEETRRLLSRATSSTSDTPADSPAEAKTNGQRGGGAGASGKDATTTRQKPPQAESHDPYAGTDSKNTSAMHPLQNRHDSSHNNSFAAADGGRTRDGEDPHAFTASASSAAPHHLEREEREAAEATGTPGNPATYHRRYFSDSAVLQQQQQQQTSGGTAYPRNTLPLIMSGADLMGPSASEPLFALANTSANGTPGDLTLDRARHQRHLTLDERLMEEGAIPVPRHVRELSAQYDRAVHSRTSSLGFHQSSAALSSSRLRHAGVEDEAESVCVDGESVPPRRGISSLRMRSSSGGFNAGSRTSRTPNALATPSAGERSRAANSARATARNSDYVSGGGVTPAEGYNNNMDEVDGPLKGEDNIPNSGVVLVSCAPTPDLSTWFGQLRMPSGEMVPLGIDQFIPRGCLIRNTDWVLGAVVYTGRHTKMLLNLRPKPNKITNMTRRLNQLNVFLFLLNQCLMFLLCGLSIWSKHYMLRQVPGAKTEFAAWYIQWSLTRYSDATLFWWRYLTNFVLLSYLIPMSLYVTLEFNKAMQMLMIGADKRMAVYDEFTGEIKKARPKTSELNCQLGHVRYIFTDKTGTLTENLMTYVGGVVDGHTHSETEQPGGIGRALLKRRGGGGGGGNGGSGTGHANQNSSGFFSNNNNNNGSGTFQDGHANRRVLSMNSAIGGAGGDDFHHIASVVASNGLDTSITAAAPQRSLLIPATGLNQSTMPADGGEAPNATTAAASTGLEQQQQQQQPPVGSGFPAGSSYQIPAALASPRVPPPPPPLTGLTHARSSGALALASRGNPNNNNNNNNNNNASPAEFGTPQTPYLNDHARVGSGMGLAAPGSGLYHHHHAVTSGSAYQWGSGTFGNFGSHGGNYASFNNFTSGGNYNHNSSSGFPGGGLSGASEAVLERDPLFRYLRALALCHSIVCFPVHGQSSAAPSEANDDDALNATQEVHVDGDGLHAATGTGDAAAAPHLTKAERKAARQVRREQRKEQRKKRGTAAEPGEPHDATDTTAEAKKEKRSHHKKHHHHHHHHTEQQQQQPQDNRGVPQRRDSRMSRHTDVVTTTGFTHSRVGSAVGLPPVSSLISLSNISAGNFVEIPYAVPAGPERDGYEPYSQSTAPDRYRSTNDILGAANDNEPITAASSAALAGRAAHARSVSSASLAATPTPPPPLQHAQSQQLVPPMIGTPHLQTNPQKLHGRTSSASWYQNRYFNRVMHSRNFSLNSNTSPRLRVASSGGAGSPRTQMNTRMLRNGVSASTAEGANNMAAGQIPGGLEAFIDRTKIYEGQSLDEIALVNAARENGFSLFERTAKQMYVKALGRVMCYDIIAELEFTPQRKLMSILLQRRPDLDSEGAATSAAAGTSAHYHRKTEQDLAAAQQAAADAAALLFSGTNQAVNEANSFTFNNNNNGSSAYFQPVGSRSYTGYDAAQSRTAHHPFTPDTNALAVPSTNDLEGADFSYSATAAALAGGRRLPAGINSLPPSPTRGYGNSSSSAAAAAAFQHARSGSVFNMSPPLLQLQSSIGEAAALRHANNTNTNPSPGPGPADAHKYLLLVKGADSSMMEIVNMQKKANARVKEKMLSELDAMAQLGLRTLVLGQRYLSEEEVLAWLPVFNEAQCAMQDRNEKLHQAYALLEKDVDIVGTTAVEDKLQDEVPQTLEFCIQASIVVWMLTGDKRETAVTIAHTSGLVSQDYTDYVCHLDVSDIVEEETLLKQQQQYEERARAKKANGEAAGDSSSSSNNDDDSEDEGHGERDEGDGADGATGVPDKAGRPLSGNQNSNSSNGHPMANSASRSIEISSATQPLPGLSSGTRSPGPQSARTVAGDVDGSRHHARKTVDPSVLASGEGDAKTDTTTTNTAAAQKSGVAAASQPSSAESFMARKVARIEAQLLAAEEKCEEGDEVFGTHTVVVVVDGKTLDFIFQDNARAHRFFMLGSRCRSAVCCRMTPLQKAKIVRMFKRNMNAVALAIGDGANDVSMIQESSIGVGIMGLEGSQAELASDYAIPKFRFLKRLLFVHGRFSVFREAHCIVYSLYKNVIVTVGMIAYQFYACYSGMSLMDSWLLAMFSIFFCSLQPLMIGILDKDVEDELAESLPKLYPPLSREFMYFSFPYIAKWLIDGMIEGLIFFFVLMYTVGWQDNLYPHMTPAIEDYGTTFFTMLVFVADFRVGTLVTYYMILFALAVSLEIIFVPIIELVYSAMNNLAGSNWCVKMANEIYATSGKFWMMLFFACGVLVVVTMASNMYIQLFYPWQNAGFAMRAARASSHRVPYERMKKELKAEYANLLARYEVLRQQQLDAAAAAEGQVGEEGHPREAAGLAGGEEAAKPSA